MEIFIVISKITISRRPHNICLCGEIDAHLINFDEFISSQAQTGLKGIVNAENPFLVKARDEREGW